MFDVYYFTIVNKMKCILRPIEQETRRVCLSQAQKVNDTVLDAYSLFTLLLMNL